MNSLLWWYIIAKLTSNFLENFSFFVLEIVNMAVVLFFEIMTDNFQIFEIYSS